MSTSAIQGPCGADLDYLVDTQKDPADFPAQGEFDCLPGFDSEGYRFDWIKQWFTELQTSPDFKVAIFPFSGGYNRFPHGYYPPSEGSYEGRFLKQNATTTEGLNHLNRIISDFNINPTGTTVLYDAIDKAFAVVEKEMTDLGPELANSQFHIVTISDGVPRPRKVDYDAALLVCRPYLGCTDSFGWPRPCDCTQYTDPDQGSLCVSCANVDTDFRNRFGDYDKNDPIAIWLTYGSLAGLGKKFSFAGLDFKLVQPNPERIHPQYNLKIGELTATNNYRMNLLQYMSTQFHQPIIAGRGKPAPFSFITASSARNYQIVDMIVTNLNARVTKDNLLEVDSDGDGLSDQDEDFYFHTDKQNARSSAQAGGKPACLDSITKGVGCKSDTCTPTWDSSSSGLNECEKFSLGTTIDSFDAAEDAIPDYIAHNLHGQVLFDNASAFDGPDSYDNKKKIKWGADVYSDLRKVQKSQLVDASFQYMGLSATGLPQYNFFIGRVPVLNTLPVSGTPQHYTSQVPYATSLIPESRRLDGTDHGPGVNQILVMIKIASTINKGEVYWLIKKIEVDFKNPQFPKFDLSTFEQIKEGP